MSRRRFSDRTVNETKLITHIQGHTYGSAPGMEIGSRRQSIGDQSETCVVIAMKMKWILILIGRGVNRSRRWWKWRGTHGETINQVQESINKRVEELKRTNRM